MNPYTNTQKWQIREWQANGMSWKKIQRRYNELYNDNRSLGGLRKVGKRGRITSYSLDRPPSKRQKPIPLATTAPMQDDRIIRPDLGKERETVLSLQIEVVAKLAETASRSFRDLILEYGGGST
ncbi:hypothetical protein V501_05561 [Pseudogymnoascus sp. VKM F-4519 (FW-2642)]|nr:hypothetical protein V501_05561 [Pseudogymnoascus sp. VKM F-4519 (FW-2642)]